ncbi:hypothetical protein N7592_03180 [Pseudomonas juntendi]|jgi:transposase|uniref:Uncharacterized protein n=1 Tax=Pseudomonas juntendi TaxID=2666183 RepID=A0ABD4YID2_9PSED|nr:MULTISPECIES: hypothetical protein [Pseudomonas]MCF3156304.1 hypothetical protein [Pseudomonas juntendi]MCO7055387.1 hypothetical protein [Pseudomonas juntendi]MCQ1990608.1 hypothetical protein [Pseudomonas sp. Eb3]MDG9872211.1 hypothetical protein [Pseudomonas juntendi]MDG9887224.1 hypothetical protein [Pseudomonas juntendi]
MNYNPALKARYEVLRARGIVLVRLNAMLRTGEPWLDLVLPQPKRV